ncbi:DNA alkylation repair protein [Fulvivirga lutimaris]|uniref:DNA alkylation repair protein n=1 Tax=Fulvivirga lutimaris TaxID=1819566 RepID=UPI0016280750|nr:DNA alkylation repair protein [Fulvivirga lutimaris]
MKSITKKSELTPLLERCISTYNAEGLDACVALFNDLILTNKIKFPLLEYCAAFLFDHLPTEDLISFCDKVEPLKTIGGNVILGIILQKRLPDHFRESIDKATEYIAKAHIWYICDIIGERVYGYSLRHQPEITIPEIKRLSKHEANWVVRSLGAGAHYAIKKGLEKAHVAIVFKLLLSMANTKDKEIKQGVGWAAKTTAKFHPDLIEQYKSEIENTDKVEGWFRTKIKIGLDRNRYAKGN